MQLDGDAGLEVRVPVTAGSRVVGVSFVRQLWEPEGLPQPLQRGRVITNDEVYMGYANVGRCRSVGLTVEPRRRLRAQGRGPEGRAVSKSRVHRAGRRARRKSAACATKIVSRLARLAVSASCERRPTCRRC